MFYWSKHNAQHRQVVLQRKVSQLVAKIDVFGLQKVVKHRTFVTDKVICLC